jgi:hypothetical protein
LMEKLLLLFKTRKKRGHINERSVYYIGIHNRTNTQDGRHTHTPLNQVPTV